MSSLRVVEHGVYRSLEAAEDASPVDALDAVTRELGLALGAAAVSFMIADLSGRALVRLAHIPLAGPTSAGPGSADARRDAEESATVLPFDGGPEEEAMRRQGVVVVAPTPAATGSGPGTSGRWRVLAPVTQRGEAIGLLEFQLPSEPGSDVLAAIGRAAHLLAFVVIANSRHTDLFEWGRRTREFTLSAEIQQRLLPGSYTCEAGAFTLSAWLEPAASVGGDVFDYSLARDVLHVSVIDAMGHDLASALTASICTGALRGTRRRGAGLREQAAAANEALVQHSGQVGSDTFATGLLGRLDLTDGVLEMVNGGHVAPYLARGGEVIELPLPVCLPFGMFPGSPYHGTGVRLTDGDRVVIATDGMLERNAADLDLAAAVGETRALHPREAVRHLVDSVLDHSGHSLKDDATMLVLDWHGHHRGRRAVAGAERVRPARPGA